MSLLRSTAATAALILAGAASTMATPVLEPTTQKFIDASRLAIAAGVIVTTTRYLSTIHDFVMLNASGDTPAAKTAIEQATDFLRSALTSVK